MTKSWTKKTSSMLSFSKTIIMRLETTWLTTFNSCAPIWRTRWKRTRKWRKSCRISKTRLWPWKRKWAMKEKKAILDSKINNYYNNWRNLKGPTSTLMKNAISCRALLRKWRKGTKKEKRSKSWKIRLRGWERRLREIWRLLKKMRSWRVK